MSVQVIDTAAMEWETTENSRTGLVFRKSIRETEICPGVTCYARLSKFSADGGAFTAPRHKHDFDQVRYHIRGTLDYGRGFVGHAGGLGFFPAGTPYGPERFEDAEVLNIQYGPMFVAKPVNDAAIRRLREKGQFVDGKYVYEDPSGRTRKLDSLQAIWEEVHGKKMTVPKARFAQIVLMDTEQFGWTSQSSGHSVKQVARFAEVDPALQLVRWNNEGSPLIFDEDRTHFVFVTEGTVVAEAKSYGKGAAIWSDAGSADSITGLAGAEVLHVAFPTADAYLAAKAMDNLIGVK